MPRRRRVRTVAAMHDSDRSGEDRALRVELELHLNRQPIDGRLRPERGEEEAFVGWLGFADALKRLHDAANSEQEERST
jgi:hypothetical protein